MSLKRYNPVKSIHIFFEKLFVAVQIFSKLPNETDDIREARNLIKNILNISDVLLFIGAESVNNVILSSNKMFTEKAGNLFNSAFSANNSPKILIVSHQFSLTGAPKAALMLAKSIRSIYGVAPVVMSMSRGPMEDEFLQENFSVCYYEELPVIKEDFLNFFNSFDLVIANSYLFEFLEKVKYMKIPVIWWEHEFFTFKKQFSKVKEFMPYLHSCWGGSPLCLKQLNEIDKNNSNYLMLYGLPEISLPEIQREHKDKIVFSLMGSLIIRKRPDLLFKAIEKMSPEIKEKAVFYIVGNLGTGADKNYGLEVLEKFKKVPEIKIVPEMPFDELLNFYSKSDVILSTSDFDPMPIVVTYGFMFKKLCLCSDAIGTALLIKDKENGVLFKAGNANDLTDKLTDIIENYKDYTSVAQNGYNIYKENFSEDMFNTNVQKLTSKAIESKRRKMKTNYKVSIITASYNYAHFISKTIDSVIAQTYDNWELIIVDDGSKDNSVEVISEYLSNPKIKLYLHENGVNKGLKETVLLGLGHADGDYIAFLESDDYWNEDYLFEKIKFINEHPDAKIVSNDIELFGTKNATVKKEEYIIYCQNSLTKKSTKIIRKEMKKWNLIPTFSCTMIEKNLLKKLNFNTDVPAWLDWWLWRQAICFANIYFIDKKLTYWQIHPQSYNQNLNYDKESEKIQNGLPPIITTLTSNKEEQ